jgi:uncharacterized protein (DUF488 family)
VGALTPRGALPLAAVMGTVAIWTVGHSNHAGERFVGLLRMHAVALVADVRSHPYSRFAPHFNRESLQASLPYEGVRYAYFGEALGGRPGSEEHYDERGRALYGPMSEQPAFHDALERLAGLVREQRVALLCAEGDPEHCHRRLLVGRVLAARGVELRHILPDGTVRAERTVTLIDGDQGTLFGEDTPWRSTQSVSRKRRLSTSSAG